MKPWRVTKREDRWYATTVRRRPYEVSGEFRAGKWLVPPPMRIAQPFDHWHGALEYAIHQNVEEHHARTVRALGKGAS